MKHRACVSLGKGMEDLQADHPVVARERLCLQPLVSCCEGQMINGVRLARCLNDIHRSYSFRNCDGEVMCCVPCYAAVPRDLF